MKMRKLGASGLEVAPLSFGGNVFGWTVKDLPTAFALLDRFAGDGFSVIHRASGPRKNYTLTTLYTRALLRSEAA